MTETMSHARVPEPVLAPNQFELSVPRNAQGERIGTGAMVEPLRPGLPGETVRGAFLKTLFRAGRTMQAPRRVAELSVNRSGLGYTTEQERAQRVAGAQEEQTHAAMQSQPDAESTQLAQAERQQKERALDATRSALRRAAAAQVEAARPQPRNEVETQPTEGKMQAEPEPEAEPVKFYSTKDGHLLFTLQLPKGGRYTTADVNRALKAAGYDFNYSPAWTPGGWRMRGRDIWQAVKKAWQASAPPPA